MEKVGNSMKMVTDPQFRTLVRDLLRALSYRYGLNPDAQKFARAIKEFETKHSHPTPDTYISFDDWSYFYAGDCAAQLRKMAVKIPDLSTNPLFVFETWFRIFKDDIASLLAEN
jgi:hypothetical protein